MNTQRRWQGLVAAGSLAALTALWAVVLINDGLTQPEATITTGVLAICAAGLAYLGVLRQISANERINERNRAVESGRAQRAERLEVIRDAIVGMGQLSRSLTDLENSRRSYVLDKSPDGWDEKAYKVCEAQLASSWALLLALGHTAVADQLFDVLRHADECVKLGDEPTASSEERLDLITRWFEPFNEAWAQMLLSFQQLLRSESPDAWNGRVSA